MNRKVHRVYFNASGRTELAQENNKWTVTVTKKDKGFEPFTYVYSFFDLVVCQEFFEMTKDFLNGKPWHPIEPVCFFDRKNLQECTASNCPVTLGGRDYWEFFCKACTYRQK